MKYLKKQFKKIFKGIKKTLAPIGKALKNGLGDVGKFFGDMGPLGTLALTLMLPGIGAAWTSFGAWAGAQGGLLGGVMNGIAQAGNLAGNVYSSVSGMISNVVGTIAGNTIGKIPVGANKNLTDVYSGFTKYVGDKLDDIRMAVKLPTSNITAETVAADAASLDKKLLERGYDQSVELSFKPSLLEADTFDPIDTKINELSAEDFATMNIDPLKQSDFTESEIQKIMDFSKDPQPEISMLRDQEGFYKPSEMSELGKQIKNDFTVERAKLDARNNLTDVIVGFEKNIKYTGVDGQEIFEMTPQIKSVPTDILSEDEIKLNNRLNNYVDYNNARLQGFEGYAGKDLKDIDAENTSRILAEYDASRTSQTFAGFTGVQESLEALSADQPVIGGYGSYSVTPLQTDTSSMNDYTRNMYPTYVKEGYRGPATMQNMYEMGYYGDDAFTKLMRDLKSYQVPQPTVTLGGSYGS